MYVIHHSQGFLWVRHLQWVLFRLLVQQHRVVQTLLSHHALHEDPAMDSAGVNHGSDLM